MMCFLDRTFCGSPNCKGECGRAWTPELSERAEKWWNPKDEPEKRGMAPIALSYFCGKPLDEEQVTG